MVDVWVCLYFGKVGVVILIVGLGVIDGVIGVVNVWRVNLFILVIGG